MRLTCVATLLWVILPRHKTKSSASAVFFVVPNQLFRQLVYVMIISSTDSDDRTNLAAQYGLGSVSVMARTGSIYLNFGLWAISLYPAWLVISQFGESLGDKKLAREEAVQESVLGSPDSVQQEEK